MLRDINTLEALNLFRKHLVATFSANNPSVLLVYNVLNGSGIGEQMGLITFGCPALPTPIQSFQSAALLSGGLSALVYLFARVVEVSNSEYLQSTALAFLLKTAHINAYLYTEFVRKNYIALIGPIIRSSRCTKGVHLLNSILEVACDTPVLVKRSETFNVITNTNACIIYPDLLVAIIKRYSDWHTADASNSVVVETLLSTLQSLVREKHPHQQTNIMQLTKAGLVYSLLNFCKIYLIGVQHPVQLSQRSSDALINLISVFAGAPPPPILLDDIVKVLLLLHRPSDSFITHDRSKFYFLLSAHPMVKHKRLSLPLPTRRLGLSIKRDRKKAAPIRSNAAAFLKMQRSISLDLRSSNNQGTEMIHINTTVPSSSTTAAATSTTYHNTATSSEGRSSEGLSEIVKDEYISEAKFTVDEMACDTKLDAIVSCSSADRRALKLLEPSERMKFERALLNMKRHSGYNVKRISNKNRQRSRTNSGGTRGNRTTTDSETDRESSKKGTLNFVLIHHIHYKRTSFFRINIRKRF